MQGTTLDANSYIWIDNPASLARMLARLRAAPAIAVDTESDSLYVYFEKVCLLQLSIPGADYLVDPLNVDITPLGELFAAEEQEKVFHAAEYDILCLKRDYGFTFANLFDTMIAARILGWKQYGLAPILEEHFQVQSDKRMQRYNWGIRPLAATALDYARLDTHYLLALRNLQVRELETSGRVVEAREAFKRQARTEVTARSFDPDDFWRIPGARQLDSTGQALLRELYVFRDGLARELDLPPFKVIPNATLLQLAADRPADRRALGQIKGLSHRIKKRRADEMLRIIVAASHLPPPVYPRPVNHRPSDDTTSRYQALRSWRKQVADARHVDPDIILPNQALMEIAQRSPVTIESLMQVQAMDDWQRQTYGEDVLKVLEHCPCAVEN
jgi:ribonuclease D